MCRQVVSQGDFLELSTEVFRTSPNSLFFRQQFFGTNSRSRRDTAVCAIGMLQLVAETCDDKSKSCFIKYNRSQPILTAPRSTIWEYTSERSNLDMADSSQNTTSCKPIGHSE